MRYRLNQINFYDKTMQERSKIAIEDDPYLTETELKSKIEASKVVLTKSQSF